MRMMLADRGTGEPISLGAALLAGKKVAPDVINLLMEDHRIVLGWFQWYEAAADDATRAKIVTAVCSALDAHMAGEEELFYPDAEEATGEEELVAHAYKEHEGAKTIIAELRRGDKSREDALMRQLHQEIAHHVREEEGKLFPAVRGSEMDLYDIGRFLAARRVERLFQLTTGSDMKEMPDMTISIEEARNLFIIGLRDAHAAARQCKTMVEAQLGRLENYPDLEAKLEAHLEEKDEQLERLETILDGLGTDRSAFKDMAMAGMGAMGSMMNSMANDEVIKNSFATYAMANFEAAAYETLILMGQAAQELDALPALQKCLSEERSMAAFVAEHLRPTGMRFLQLRSEGSQASH